MRYRGSRALLVSALALAWLVAGAAEAQIAGVWLKDEKTAKRYKKWVRQKEGRFFIPGEPWVGLDYNPETNGFNRVQNQPISLIWLDNAKPDARPYKLDEARRRIDINKKAIVMIQPGDLPAGNYAWMVMRDESLEGLRRAWSTLEADLEALTTATKGLKKGTPEYAGAWERVARMQARQQSWLRSTWRGEAAAKMDKAVAKTWKKAAAKQAKDKAREAGRTHDVDAEEMAALNAALREVDPLAAFKLLGLESAHIRITYPDTMSTAAVAGLLKMGEEVIADFRAEYVRPHLDWVADKIPDKVFQHFVFLPSARAREGLYEKFYKLSWGSGVDRQRSLGVKGSGSRGVRGIEYFSYWLHDGVDTAGIVTHRLGHTLMNLHFARGRRGENQPWLGEAFGYAVSYNYLNKNTVTCVAWGKNEYARAKVEEVDKPIELGLRAKFTSLALDEGLPVTRLFTMKLFEMNGVDLAKAWSFLDFLVREKPRQGLEFLVALVGHAKQGAKTSGLVEKARQDANGIFNATAGQDVYDILEHDWRAYAEALRASGFGADD